MRPADRRANVKLVSEVDLESLPGIGPVIAHRTIDGRPYRSVDDLRRVQELRPKRLEEIRPLGSTQGAAEIKA